MEAAKSGDVKTMAHMLASNQRLLMYRGQGTAYSFTAHTALHWAAAKGRVHAVRWLLQQGAGAGARNAAGGTPLHAALSNRQLEAAHVLLLEGAADWQVGRRGEGCLGYIPSGILLSWLWCW
jgi:hypothetical protein